MRGVGLDQVEVPLLAPARVGRARGRRRGGGSKAGRRGRGRRTGKDARLPGADPERLYAITYVRMEVATHVGSARPRAPRGHGPLLRDLAERSGVSAPMLSPGRARRDEPDADGRQPHRRRPRPPPLPAAAPRRGRHRHRRARRATAARGGADGHRCEILTPPLPGQRAEVSTPHARSPAPAPAARATRRCTSPARARPRVVQRGTLTFVCDGARHELATGDAVTFDADLPHHFENQGEEEAVLLAVVSAGLRRS